MFAKNCSFLSSFLKDRTLIAFYLFTDICLCEQVPENINLGKIAQNEKELSFKRHASCVHFYVHFAC